MPAVHRVSHRRVPDHPRVFGILLTLLIFPGQNCTQTLIKQPRCADPSWILCENNGYICCAPGQICLSHNGTGNRDSNSCADPGYDLRANEIQLPTVNQVPRAAQSTAPVTAAATPQPNDGLNTADKIAIGMGVPGGVATMIGTWFAWRMYKRSKGRTTSAKRVQDF